MTHHTNKAGQPVNPQLIGVAQRLRDAGATLPAPQVGGTIESAMNHGLCIALALVEEAIAQQVAVPDGKQNIGTKPVNGNYFLCQCDKCGWLGSSEETRVSINHGYGDGDYYCPVCGTIEPEEVVSASTTFNAMLSAAQKGGAQ